jgi:4-hydroxy-2-oxoheptanedioate aldolase
MARAGFDWLAVDMEHSAQSVELMGQMVAAIAESQTCAPFVRIPYNSVEWFKWALDAGAWGIIVPMVGTRQEAERAVQCSRYPPQGIRSIGGLFAPYSFGTSDRTAYAAAANNEIMVIVQIESAQALANLDAILSVPGLDVAFVGPYDLHAQLGLPPAGDSTEPSFLSALEQIKTTARQYHLPLGIYSSNGETAARRIQQGFHLVSVASDSSCLMAAAQQQLADATDDTPA